MSASLIHLHSRRIIEFSLLHSGAILLTMLVSYYMELIVLTRDLAHVFLTMPFFFFFPALIKALAAWMYGWFAVIYIFPTTYIQYILAEVEFTPLSSLLFISYLISAPLVMTCRKHIVENIWRVRFKDDWRQFLVLTLLSSVLVGQTWVFVMIPNASIFEVASVTALLVIGDVFCAVLGLLILIMFFRIRDRLDSVALVRKTGKLIRNRASARSRQGN